jgi:hypothetical protein
MLDHVYQSDRDTSSPFSTKLLIVLGLVAGLSACAEPYGNAGYGYNEPAYYTYGPNTPVYYGPGYYFPRSSQHGTVQY